MDLKEALAVAGVFGTFLGASGVIAWFKLGPERRKLRADANKSEIDADSQIFKDLNVAYNRVSDELSQALMRIRAVETENETLRQQTHNLQVSITTLQGEINRQARLSALARARSHMALKMLGNYELHIDFLLDEMRDARIEITPIMRTSKLRVAFQAQMDRLEAMEVQELENLIKQASEMSAT